MENNNIDKNLYNEKSLYLLNIRELRDIGRKFGVPSPTTMKKHDLVDYILKVVYGEIKPPIRNACGRPNSREFDMNKYIDKIKKNVDLTEELIGARLSDDQRLRFVAAAPKDEEFNPVIEQRIVNKNENGFTLRVRQFIESENDYKIDEKIADKFNLENYDVVEIIKSSDDIKIITVNGKKVSNDIIPFEIEYENIRAGSRKVFHLRTKEKIKENIEKIIKNSKEQGLKVVSFGENEIDGAKNFILAETT